MMSSWNDPANHTNGCSCSECQRLDDSDFVSACRDRLAIQLRKATEAQRRHRDGLIWVLIVFLAAIMLLLAFGCHVHFHLHAAKDQQTQAFLEYGHDEMAEREQDVSGRDSVRDSGSALQSGLD